MIPPDSLVLLDTTILVDLARGKTAGEKIDERYQLRTRKEKPLISVVTHGEMLVLASVFGWGATKIAAMRDLLRELVTVDISKTKVLTHYGEITAYCRKNGINQLSDNDCWIAACTAAADACLLTGDRDFDPLHDKKFIRREYVDPESLK